MTKRSGRIYFFSFLLLCGAFLLVFRYELMFGFQRLRLQQLGCPTHERIKPAIRLDRLSACQKLWPHRVDSYERFMYLTPYFPGLETDLVFDRSVDKFRICHPPAPLTDLIADTYFKAIAGTGKKLWLDVKDLAPADILQAAQYFLRSDSLYQIRQNVIIESSEIRLVNLLAERGFITSFLVPPQYFSNSGGKAGALLSLHLLPEVAFVSQQDNYLQQLKDMFPGKKIITWSISIRNYFDLTHLRSLVEDTSVCVVLINIKSRHYQ